MHLLNTYHAPFPQAHTSLTPVCIFTGAPNALSNWLKAKGVRVVFHRPKWADRLIAVQVSTYYVYMYMYIIYRYRSMYVKI